ncbi:hypothetical protein CRG98_003603 [Punica granatum]|uniref:Uncharacterized protein n=1 Tax=Punica granatum TaxID=22663 RepID=A0A2I0L614_PUNGR|nr:hypothetical protein CRG98_003603 [Punica granatum]
MLSLPQLRANALLLSLRLDPARRAGTTAISVSTREILLRKGVEKNGAAMAEEGRFQAISESRSSNLKDVRPIRHAALLELANVKTAMGRREEAVGNLRKCLEIKEMMFEEGGVELGKLNRDEQWREREGWGKIEKVQKF